MNGGCRTKEKEQEYQTLISEVRQYYLEQGKLHQNDPVYLTWCDDCKEINLWTYWQGHGNLDARIMLVGQDWGCPEAFPSVIQNIKEINNSVRSDYHFDDINPTDLHLVALFKSIGYDIPNVNARNEDLFFTNFVLGYRNKGLTGGFQQRWVNENKAFFSHFANIIEPEIMICLGQKAFHGVMKSFDQKVKVKSYNTFITGIDNPKEMSLQSGKTVYVFAEAHCGAIGTLNRNRLKDPDGTERIELQIQDWARIKALLNRLHGSA
jgi:DNA polymerase